MKDKLIWCDTKEKLKKVAQKLKSDGFSITDTETIWRSYGTESVLSVHTKYKSITYCSRDWYIERGYATPITADEFLGKSKKPSIVIFQRGREVIAKDISTGNEGIAKCSPNDEFNFHTGASIALARLMAKTPEALNHDVKDEWINVLGLTHYYKCKQKSGYTYFYSEQMLDKWDESKICEGDTVKVINTGLNYTSYVKWVEEHISDPSMAARFCFGTPDTSKKYKVIKIAEHEKNHRPLAFIEEIDGFSYNSCYLIEVKGLEKV